MLTPSCRNEKTLEAYNYSTPFWNGMQVGGK